jgi:hypothetical protein
MSIASQWRRITAKPPRELAARAAAVVHERIERWRYAKGRLSPADRLAQALGTPRIDAAALLSARRAKRPPFFPSVLQRSAIRRVIKERYQTELDDTRTWAARAQRHEFHFFGRAHAYGSEIDWHADPITRQSWPTVFFEDAYSSAVAKTCDVKDVWELSRQQFVIDLGKSYFVDGVEEHAAEARRLVRSWLSANPYATGINWASPLEPAYRSFSWLWAYYLTLDDPALDPVDHEMWVEGFLDSGRFLHDHLELFSSPYNHLIGEATALYLLGTLFPEFAEAHAWRRRGRMILESRLPAQFYGDGGTVEQATLYHHATLGFYLLAALVGRANGDELSPAVWAAIERAIEFSMLMVQPDGELPVIGDTDDARPIQLERKPFFDFRAYLAMGAVLFGRQDFKAIAGRFHEDALWILGTDGLVRFEDLGATEPERRTAALSASGYFVTRSDWGAGADYVCFDCGDQAGGLRPDDVPSAAHGHADCLSVVVFLRGRPVLVDSGLFTYNGELSWERHFRETAAHNTARVDGRDQATHLAKMAWTHVPRPRIEYVADLDDACFVGSHDGFLAATGIRHRRFVWYRRDGGYVVLFDDFDGPGGHTLDLHFHFAPLDVTLGDGTLSAGDVARMHWVASFPAMASVTRGGVEAAAGWVAPSLGVRVAAPVLTLTGRSDRSGASMLTVLAPCDHHVSRPSSQSGIALAVESPAWIDEIQAVPSHDSGPSNLTVTRRRNGTVVQRLHAAASRASEYRQ